MPGINPMFYPFFKPRSLGDAGPVPVGMYLFAVSTQGIGAWAGPSPSPTSAKFDYQTESLLWQNSPSPLSYSLPDSAAAADPFGFGPAPNITGMALYYPGGLEGTQSLVNPVIPVVSYINPSNQGCIAYNNGGDWTIVIPTELGLGSNWQYVKVMGAGGKVFVSAYGGDGNDVRLFTMVDGAPVLTSTPGPGSYAENFITTNFDGTPIMLRKADSYFIPHVYVGGSWVDATPYIGTDRFDDNGVGAPGGWCTGAFFSIAGSIRKLVFNAFNTANVVNEGVGGAAYVCGVDQYEPGNATPNPTAVWTKASPTDRSIYIEAASGSTPITAVTYSSPYKPGLLTSSIVHDGQGFTSMIAVIVNVVESTASPKLDVYMFKNDRTLEFVSSSSYPGHYIPAEDSVYVDAATIGPITLNGVQDVDGYSTGDGNTILVKDQPSPAQNGIFTTSSSGDWVRTTGSDTWAGVYRTFVTVFGGSFNAFTSWSCDVGPTGTLGSTSITYSSSFKPEEAESGNLGNVAFAHLTSWIPGMMHGVVGG